MKQKSGSLKISIKLKKRLARPMKEKKNKKNMRAQITNTGNDAS